MRLSLVSSAANHFLEDLFVSLPCIHKGRASKPTRECPARLHIELLDPNVLGTRPRI